MGDARTGKRFVCQVPFSVAGAGWETETDSGTDAFPGSLGATVASGLDSDARIAFRHRTAQ